MSGLTTNTATGSRLRTVGLSDANILRYTKSTAFSTGPAASTSYARHRLLLLLLLLLLLVLSSLSFVDETSPHGCGGGSSSAGSAECDMADSIVRRWLVPAWTTL